MTATTNKRSEVDQAYYAVARHAERIANDGEHDLSGMEAGDWWAQGDVRIDRLPDDFARRNAAALVPDANPSPQLAPGDTQGSRHCLDSLTGVTVYRLRGATPLDGPVLVTTEARRVTHPEHGDVSNLPPGVYGVRYQRAFAEELRRVAD